MMITRSGLACLIMFGMNSSAWSQESDEVQRGRMLAINSCTLCHVAAPDQPSPPFMRPPAPSFESIAQRPTTNEDSIKRFLTTTHMGLDNPNGMPNPKLADFEVRQVTAYLLSLRKH